MEAILKFLPASPTYPLDDFYIWLFSAINLLWLCLLVVCHFAYKSKLRHAQDAINAELETRRKVFEMKAFDYENYLHDIDVFYRRHQNDYQAVFLPLFNEFHSRYKAAELAKDTAAIALATLWFSEEIQKITTSGQEEKQKLALQSNTLKLTASDEVNALLEELQALCDDVLTISTDTVKFLVGITINDDYDKARQIQQKLHSTGESIQQKARQLHDVMRQELRQL